jgi:predicted metal-dependent HD superfamily phosphohydrolase
MTDIIQAAEKHVTAIFASKHDAKLFYHNIGHTRYVVNAARLIGEKCGINGHQMEALLIAAWFHDVGYVENKINHEDLSKQQARLFLAENGFDNEFIEQVERCIEATRIPQNPVDQLSAILCDADLFNVSQPDFLETARNFWNELAAFYGHESTMRKYITISLNFFSQHDFHTEYGRTVLEEGKKRNIAQMKLTLEEEIRNSEEFAD